MSHICVLAVIIIRGTDCTRAKPCLDGESDVGCCAGWTRDRAFLWDGTDIERLAVLTPGNEIHKHFQVILRSQVQVLNTWRCRWGRLLLLGIIVGLRIWTVCLFGRSSFDKLVGKGIVVGVIVAVTVAVRVIVAVS